MRRVSLQQLSITGAGLVPAALLTIGLWRDALGANPVETLSHETGIWALRLLLSSLAVTPARRLCGVSGLAPLRRTLGLLAFFYAVLHLGVYVVLDQGLEWHFIVEDIRERPYVTAGMTGFLCMLPLAITSTRGWIRRLGRRWVKLHRLAYVAGIAAAVHFLWLVKADVFEPVIYLVLLTLLLTARLLGPSTNRASTRLGFWAKKRARAR